MNPRKKRNVFRNHGRSLRRYSAGYEEKRHKVQSIREKQKLAGIEKMKKEGDVVSLAFYLNDPDFNVRMLTAHALGEMGVAASEAAPDLISLLHKKDVQSVHVIAAEALGNLKNPIAIIPLKNIALTTRNKFLATAIVHSLMKISGRKAKAALESIASSDKVEREIRELAAYYYRKMGNKQK